MPEPQSPASSEVANGARSILNRVGEFFHIFDLSFLVSGAMTLCALICLSHRLGLSFDFPFSVWVEGLGIIIASYVSGLISFSVGRLLNTNLFRKPVLGKILDPALKQQGVTGPFIDFFRERDRDSAQQKWLLWRLYMRLWQQLAAKHPHSVAFHHLSRYWAMAATYDGLAISLLVWALVVAPVPSLGATLLPFRIAMLAVPIFVAAALLCLWQGAKYYEFQIEDLVAALAVMGPTVE